MSQALLDNTSYLLTCMYAFIYISKCLTYVTPPQCVHVCVCVRVSEVYMTVSKWQLLYPLTDSMWLVRVSMYNDRCACVQGQVDM